MLWLRRILFYLFVLIYAVSCPWTILYALGYFYKPGAEYGIAKSGLISLSSAPSGATIYIQNKKYAKKTPALIERLLPGEYPVRLVLKDHREWFQTLPVEAEKATALEKVLLLPSVPKKETIWQEKFQTLTGIPGTKWILLSRGALIEDLFIYDLLQKKSWPLLGKDSPWKGMRVIAQYVVPESPEFILKVNSAAGEKLLWVEPDENDNKLEDISPLFFEGAGQVSWDPKDRNKIFSFKEGALSRYDITTHKFYPAVLQDVRAYGFDNRKIYALKKTPLLVRTDFEGKSEETLLDDANLIKSIFGEKEYFGIRVLTRNVLAKPMILFWGETGKLIGNRLPYRFVEEGVEGFEYYHPEDRVLVWMKERLGIIDFSNSPRQESVFESGPELVWIFKKGKKIEQAFWVYEGSHILFRDQNSVFLVEFETYGRPNLDLLIETQPASSIFYSEETGKVYYIEIGSGHLCSMEIVPKREIIPLVLPETKERIKRRFIQELT